MYINNEQIFTGIYSLLALVFLLFGFRPPSLFATTSRLKDKLKSDGFGLESKVKERQESEIRFIQPLLSTIAIESKSYFEKKIFAAIDYAIKRHDWYEDQRSKMVQIQITLASVVTTAIVAIVRNSAPREFSVKIGLLATVFVSLIFVMRILYLYVKNLDGDPPHRLISDIRFWFFRYNLPTISSYVKSIKFPESIVERELAQRQNFMDRIKENFDVAKSMREDIEQIYILHVLQRYKSESLYKMRYVVAYYVVFLLIQCFTAVVYFLTMY